MDTEQADTYRSKVDWWIAVLMTVVPFIHIPLGVWAIFRGHPGIGVMVIFWGLIMGVIIIALSWPCHYTLDSERLTIRSGLMTDPIRFTNIDSIAECQTWMPGPALSLDRVRVDLKDGSTRILSPTRKKEFIERVVAAIQERSVDLA